MNKNEPLLAPEALKRSTPNLGMERKWKIVLAFFLGVIFVFMTFFLAWVGAASQGEVGDAAICFCVSFIGMGVCFLITQYFLSRGNRQAVCKDWPLILAMNFAPFCTVIVALAALTKWAGLVMLVVTIITLACSYAGAGLAALTARRRSP
jgi:cytochrome bd-type quinol oxidase subunit 2